jgi:hypothetical protein
MSDQPTSKATDVSEGVASAVAMIRTMDVHEAAKDMAKKLRLNAEIRTCVGKWDENGSVAGWVTSGRTSEPATTLVEVFVSDLAGEGREFNRYARAMEELIAENERLKALSPPLPSLEVERASGWLIEERAGDFIHWITLAEGTWPLTKTVRLRHSGAEIEKYLTPVHRVKDAGEALRFARKEDAETFIRLFKVFLLGAIATEHCWPPLSALPPLEDRREEAGR